RLARADRDRLSVLAAEPALHAQVVPDRVDPLQDVEAVADQRGAAHWSRNLPLLDQIALGDAEHEVARRRLDLAARERDGVEASLDVADDLFRRRVARGDVGVRHPGNRQVTEALSAAVAGRRPAILARARQVVEEEAQLALVDHAGEL